MLHKWPSATERSWLICIVYEIVRWDYLVIFPQLFKLFILFFCTSLADCNTAHWKKIATITWIWSYRWHLTALYLLEMEANPKDPKPDIGWTHLKNTRMSRHCWLASFSFNETDKFQTFNKARHKQAIHPSGPRGKQLGSWNNLSLHPITN